MQCYKIQVVTDAEYGRVMNLLKGWDTLDENPLLMGLNDSMNHTEDLVKRLWSGKGDFKAVRDRVSFGRIQKVGGVQPNIGF